MTPQDIIDKIKAKALEYAKTHATENAKQFYVLGKKDAAATFLAMVQSEGAVVAIKDVAAELLRSDPSNAQALWITENEDKWKFTC